VKLNKSSWESVKFGDYVDHNEETETNTDIRKSSRFVSVEHIETGEIELKRWTNEVMPTFFRKFKTGQILFGKRRAYQRKVAIAEFDGICSPHIWALQSKEGLSQNLLPYIMLTDNFYEYVNSNSAGTMSPYVKWPQLSKYTFLLPSHLEQNQISELFLSLEKVFFKTEFQERNLRALYNRLINDFISEKPIFGKLLRDKQLIKVKYGNVTKKIKRKFDPITNGNLRIVSGENLGSEDFKIRTWGTVGKDFLGPAFNVLFLSGDILYGSRRTYLKKVAYADFDGVCANTTYVIRADEEILLQDLLKHIMLSERFTQYSISVSKGSTNPYINWKDLDNFTFQIPDLKTQEEIANVLDAVIAMIELVKTQKDILRKLKQKLLNEILG